MGWALQREIDYQGPGGSGVVSGVGWQLPGQSRYGGQQTSDEPKTQLSSERGQRVLKRAGDAGGKGGWDFIGREPSVRHSGRRGRAPQWAAAGPQNRATPRGPLLAPPESLCCVFVARRAART